MGKNREVLPEVKKEPKKEEIKEELVDAVVDGTDYLNIRREPEVKPNNQITILGRGTKIIVVDPKKTTKNKDAEWFKIRLKKDASPDDPTENGYAMKQYIKVV